ncbi:unnamed protein product [Durusdinium trenchii]|uniref:EamA domain-containing protein n=2 Tax=Durusdinium trenchii TaxID=1381693 RepID=A0ABP0K4F2_9DINO
MTGTIRTRSQPSVVASHEESDPKPHHCSGHVRGILATLLGALSLAIAALLVKVCAKSLSTLDILCGRAILQTCFVGVVFLTRCESPWGPRNLRGWLSLRGFLGCCAVVFYFMGIIALPLSDSISIYSVKPIFAALLGACVLGEPLTCIHAIATGLSLCGCILVAKEEHGASKSKHAADLYLDPVIAVVLLLLAALMAAGTTITTRKVMAGTALKAEVPVWYFCFMDLLLLGIATPFVYGTSFGKRSGDISWQHLVALAGVAICSVLGQQLFTLGLRHIPSALSTLLLQMETVDAFILQIVFVGKVGPMSLVGASLICIGTASLALFELRATRRDAESDSSPLSGDSCGASGSIDSRDLESHPVGHAVEEEAEHLN